MCGLFRFDQCVIDIFTRCLVPSLYHFFLFASLTVVFSDGAAFEPNTHRSGPSSMILPQKQATASCFVFRADYYLSASRMPRRLEEDLSP